MNTRLKYFVAYAKIALSILFYSPEKSRRYRNKVLFNLSFPTDDSTIETEIRVRNYKLFRAFSRAFIDSIDHKETLQGYTKETKIDEAMNTIFPSAMRFESRIKTPHRYITVMIPPDEPYKFIDTLFSLYQTCEVVDLSNDVVREPIFYPVLVVGDVSEFSADELHRLQGGE